MVKKISKREISNKTKKLFEKATKVCPFCGEKDTAFMCTYCGQKLRMQGKREAYDSLLLLLPEIYPTDLFPEIPREELIKINDAMQKKFGYPLDRLSAHITRLIIKRLLEELKEGEKKDG